MGDNFGSNSFNYGQPNLGFAPQQHPSPQFAGGQTSSLYPQLNQPYPLPGYGACPDPAAARPNLPYPISPMGPMGNIVTQPYPSPGYPSSGFDPQYPSAATGNIQNPSGFNAPYPPTNTESISSSINNPYPPSSENISNPSLGTNTPYNQSNSVHGSPYPTSTRYNSGYGTPYPNTIPSYNEGLASNTAAPYSTLSQSGYSQQGMGGFVQESSQNTQSYGNNMPIAGHPNSTICGLPSDRPTIRASMSFDAVGDSAVLRKAMKGIGTDEKAIINVLGRRTSDQRQQIILGYQQSYGKDLIKDLKSELSGNFEQAILALMTPLPVYLASELYKAMKGFGTKESVLIEILCTQDNNMIRAIKAAYQQSYKKTLEKDIQDDTSGHFQRLLISVCAGARQEGAGDSAIAQRLAHELYKAGEGRWGTNESELNRIMAAYSRSQLQMVFAEYKKIKGRSVEDAIKSELSGELKTSMLALYDSIENRPTYFAKKLREAMAGLGTKDDALIRLIASRCEIDLGSIKEEYQRLYKKTLESAVSSETSGDYKRILLILLQD